jgi:hypothetical protein
MIGSILNWIRERISNLPSGVAYLAELRLVPPDGTYVMLPYFEVDPYPIADGDGEVARVREAEDQA